MTTMKLRWFHKSICPVYLFPSEKDEKVCSRKAWRWGATLINSESPQVSVSTVAVL